MSFCMQQADLWNSAQDMLTKNSLFSIRFLSEQALLLDRMNELLYTMNTSKSKVTAPHLAGFFLDNAIR